MGMYNAVPPPPEQATPSSPAHPPLPVPGIPIDIEAWTASALQSLSVSPATCGNPLSIPLDEHPTRPGKTVTLAEQHPSEGVIPPRRPPSRRDSQRKREALLKGKEGSRQRRRWENDRLVGVPNVQPPLPIDLHPAPTHPVHKKVPYRLARHWESGLRQRVDEESTRRQTEQKRRDRAAGKASGLCKGEVPRELRDVVKRSAVVGGWVSMLEAPVRRFLVEEGGEWERVEAEDDDDGGDSEEEIVFVGRRAPAQESSRGPLRARLDGLPGLSEPGLVFEEIESGKGAPFKRWLTHSIAGYYGLESRSITVGSGSATRRVVYVSQKAVSKRTGAEIPRPLAEVCISRR